MKDIPNTKYITITADGIFVGGKPAIYYRGIKICDREGIKASFQAIHKKYPNIQEMHFLTSETTGEYLAQGNPVAKNGSCAWARTLFNDGYVAPWALVSSGYPYDFTIEREIVCILYRMTGNPVFLGAVLGDYKDVTITLNLQNMTGKSFELNGYKITIEKIAQGQKQR